MEQVKEAYVSFEVAKLLKKKGFDWNCITYYVDFEPNDVKYSMFVENNTTWEEHCYSATTQQMAMRWLREVHGLHISLEPCYDYDSMHVVFLAFVQNVADVHEFMDGRKNVASHPNAEKSYELAIQYCLENLI